MFLFIHTCLYFGVIYLYILDFQAYFFIDNKTTTTKRRIQTMNRREQTTSE